MQRSESDARDRGAPLRGARVDARHLSRSFGEREALVDVTLEIAPGESFALLGANGAGKTTFIRLLTGYLAPSSGEVRVDGLSPTAHAAVVQPRIGYAPESARLHPELRVDRSLAFAAALRGIGGAARRAAVDAAIERFALGAVARRPIGHLSKGFAQRVSLAQAFLHEPDLLVVDEPTSGLDPLQQRDVRSAVASLRGSCTVVLCTHDLAEARELAQRAGVLANGRLVACGSTTELLAGNDPLALFRAAPDANHATASEARA